MAREETGSQSRTLRIAFADYGMVIVLMVLMAGFSALTIREQSLTGREAGRDVAITLKDRITPGGGIFIAAPGSLEDKSFVSAVREQAMADGVAVLGAVSGSPADVRQALEGLLSDDRQLDVIVVTGVSKDWKIFERYPQLTREKFVWPASGKWPDFLKRTNLIGVANQTAIYAVIAIGMTMVIISGGIDLSVGSVVALSSVTATVVLRDYFGGVNASPGDVLIVGCLAILVGALAGTLNGLLITIAQLPPFIVTLAMMLIASGLAMRLSGFQSINAVPPSFQQLGAGTMLGIPNPILIMIVLYAAAHILMSRTVFGRMLYAIGGNAEAARLCGIQVPQMRTLVYAICGALAGLGGIMVSSRLNAGDPKYGDMYELQVIAAVVVGGTSLMGGEGRMLGTLIGAFIIAVISNGMNLMSVEASNQKVVLGTVLLLSVLADRIKRTRFAG
jgi:ribose transport system permease protein